MMSGSVLFSPGTVPDVLIRATCQSTDVAIAVAIQKAATEMGSSRRLVVIRGNHWQRLDGDSLIDVAYSDVPAAAPLIILLSLLLCIGVGLALLVLVYGRRHATKLVSRKQRAILAYRSRSRARVGFT